MIGIFDSGEGGALAMSYLRKLKPDCDICLYQDKQNAPYGTKKKDELIEYISSDIVRLYNSGADGILIACCTASSLYREIPEKYRRLATPIITPVARAAAAATRCGKVAVLATERTVKERAFGTALSELGVTSCKEYVAGELVSLVEGGCRDGNVSVCEREIIKSVLSPLKDFDADTLILGCTHFPWLKNEISKILPGMRVIDSALIGAEEIIKKYPGRGTGKSIIL